MSELLHILSNKLNNLESSNPANIEGLSFTNSITFNNNNTITLMLMLIKTLILIYHLGPLVDKVGRTQGPTGDAGPTGPSVLKDQQVPGPIGLQVKYTTGSQGETGQQGSPVQQVLRVRISGFNRFNGSQWVAGCPWFSRTFWCHRSTRTTGPIGIQGTLVEYDYSDLRVHRDNLLLYLLVQQQLVTQILMLP